MVTMATTRNKIALLINDIHIDKQTVNVATAVCLQAFEYAVANGVRNVIFGGDVFTNRSGQPLVCLNTWRYILDQSKVHNLTLHVIPGNHDKTDKNAEESYLDVFDSENQILYRKAGSFVVGLGGARFVMIPYFGEERWLEELKRIENERAVSSKVSFLITHIAVNGVRNNDGTVVEDAVEPDILSRYTKVLVGHYHNVSRVGKNVFYTGAAYQGDFGENIQDKGFTVIYDDGSLEHVQTDFPKFRSVEVQATDRETLRNVIEKFTDSQKDGGDRVRIKILGKRSECEKINVQQIRDAGIEYKFCTDEETTVVEVSCSEGVTTFDKSKITREFLQFCNENNIRGKEMKAGFSLLKENL
jgi:exonuclease SbcD